MIGSTDMGNVSHVVPAIHPYLSIGPADLVGLSTESANEEGSIRLSPSPRLSNSLLPATMRKEMSATDRIKKKLARLPSSPGVYLMKDAKGEVIYVGKAAVLKNRVRSYFHSPQGMTRKTRRLAQEIADFEVVQTSTEVEAFILEDSLIKRYQPRFNIRLRDDKRYPYLKITNEPYPRVMIVRRRRDDGARYFGPYTNAKAMRSLLKLAQKIFPIRTCTLNLPLQRQHTCVIRLSPSPEPSNGSRSPSPTWRTGMRLGWRSKRIAPVSRSSSFVPGASPGGRRSTCARLRIRVSRMSSPPS
jgi:hypothetical protein